MLGRRQVVRQEVLILPFGGSSPSAPANQILPGPSSALPRCTSRRPQRRCLSGHLSRTRAPMSDSSAQLMLFSGSANPALAQDIANYLHMPLGKMPLGRFWDGD
eukprot:gene19533-24975_t